MSEPLARISTAGTPFSWTIWTLLTTRGGPKFCADVPTASTADSINRYADCNPNRSTQVLKGDMEKRYHLATAERRVGRASGQRLVVSGQASGRQRSGLRRDRRR